MDQLEFKKTIEEFKKMKDARDQLWDRARNLVKEGFEVEAYILILATWDFAYFRYDIKKFDLDKFRKVIERVNTIFKEKELENKRFKDVDFEKDEVLVGCIKDIFSAFKEIVKQTGASKLMALKSPNLFVMWDTEIRKIYEINNRGEANDYIEFLKKIQKEFAKIEWDNKEKPFAKAIDEYNYVIADKNREKKKRKEKLKQNNGQYSGR